MTGKQLIYFIFLLIPIRGIAQSRASIDSLEKVLNQQIQSNQVDTNDVQTALKLSTYYSTRDTLKALNFIQFAQKWSNKLNYTRGLANTYRNYGRLYMNGGRFLNSLDSLKIALKIYKQLNDEKGIGYTFADIGTNYQHIGNLDKALNYDFKALSIFQSIPDSISLTKELVNIGIVYYQNNNDKKALTFFKEPLSYFKNHKIYPVLSAIYNNMGVLLRKEKKTDKALEYHLKAEKIRKKLGDLGGLGYSYFNIGNIYKDKKDYALALKYHFKAVAIRKKLNSISDLSFSYFEIGSIYLQEGYPTKALKYSDLSYHYAMKSNSLKDQERALKLKTDIYSSQGRYREAFLFNKKYNTVKDSIMNYKKAQKFAELTNLYQAQKKNQEIKILKKNKSIQITKLKKAQTLKDALIIGSILLLITIILLTKGYQIKKHSEEILQKKNKDLGDANKRIILNEKTMKRQAELLTDANKKLTAKNKQLELLDESKNDFFRIAAHDLKNPLVGISSLSQIMKENIDGNTQQLKEQLNMIHRSSNEMIELISRLLKVNEIDSESLQVKVKNENICPLIQMTVKNYQSTAISKDISLHYDCENSSIEALIDQSALRQIAENLISNAIKFSKSGSNIWIRVQKNDDQAEISVRDEGQGIPPDEKDKLFHKFSRLSPQPTQGENSSGLGLYITKKLTESMGGTIECDSQVGKGSTFIVHLPLTSKRHEVPFE